MEALKFLGQLFLFIFMLVAFMVLITSLGCSPAPETKVLSSGIAWVSEPTEQALEKAMKYHGVLFAYQDRRGEWWFTNSEGETCKLFPESWRP